MGVKHTVLPDGQPPTVAFTEPAQLRGPKASETDLCAVLFTKNCEGRNSDLDFCPVSPYTLPRGSTDGRGSDSGKGRNMKTRERSWLKLKWMYEINLQISNA